MLLKIFIVKKYSPENVGPTVLIKFPDFLSFVRISEKFSNVIFVVIGKKRDSLLFVLEIVKINCKLLLNYHFD